MNHRSNLLALLLVLPTPTTAMDKATKDKLIIFSVACVGALCGNLLANALYPSRSKLNDDAMKLLEKVNPRVAGLECKVQEIHKDLQKIKININNLKETDDWNITEFTRIDNQCLNLKTYIDKVEEESDSRYKELVILKNNNGELSDWCLKLEKKIDTDLQKCQQLCFYLSEHTTKFVSIENKLGGILKVNEDSKARFTKIEGEQEKNRLKLLELETKIVQVEQTSSLTNHAESKDGE